MGHVRISDETVAQYNLRGALGKLATASAGSPAFSTNRFDQRYEPGAVVSQALKLSTGQRTSEADGLLLPNRGDILGQERATYVTTSNDNGGYLVAPARHELAQQLKPVSVLDRLGVRRIEGLEGGSLFVASISAGATAAHFGETDPVPETGGSFGTKAEIKACHVGVRVDISREMLIQAAFDLDAWVTQDLSTSLAAAQEAGVIAGDGTANKPVGLLATSGTGAVSFAGATPTFSELVDMLDDLGAANVPIENVRWLMHPQMLCRLLKLADTSTMPVFGGRSIFDPAMVFTSASCPLTKIVAGDWEKLSVLSWGRTELRQSSSVSPDFVSRFMLESFYNVWVEVPSAFVVGTSTS